MADPDGFDADPDPTFQADADPDPKIVKLYPIGREKKCSTKSSFFEFFLLHNLTKVVMFIFSVTMRGEG